MGFAIADEARRRGARVSLVAGPTQLEPPVVDEMVTVRSASEMHAAVMRLAADADIVVMAAAVADYAPPRRSSDKMSKTDAPLTLTLERTPDILADLGRLPSRTAGTPLLVGFAAETGDVVAKARAKRARKQIDLIVANDVSRADAGFDVETNAVTIVSATESEEIPLQHKSAVAAVILDRVERLMTAHGSRLKADGLDDVSLEPLKP
jgi:phosphopantothenoylcysteine decarboxylase/phosphopantothenate--cysteine ligase